MHITEDISRINDGGAPETPLQAVEDSAEGSGDEQIIVDDAAALFTVHWLNYELVKPYVKGYVLTPIDIPIERYMWLEGK